MESAARTDKVTPLTASRYDGLRKQIPFITAPNKLVCTAGIAEKFSHCMGRIMDQVKQYDTFTPDNDPWKEHDFGAFEFEGQKIFWKIDDFQGVDGLQLVLTVMLAEEW